MKSSATNLALATVIDVKGSSYRRTGARMLIQDNGLFTGGISGGCIEGNALKKAHLAISQNKATRVTYDTSIDDEAQIGVSLGCNGVISVLISPVNSNDANNPIEQLKACLDARESTILITVLEADDNLGIVAGQVIKYISEDGLREALNKAYLPAISNDLRQIKKTMKSDIKTYPGCQLFLEIIPPATQILIMGGNYDVYPLLKITKNLGWQAIIIGNAKRLARDRHQLADGIVEDLDETKIDNHTVAILMSHDYNADLKNLKNTLATDISYIGLLGPASRKKEMLEELSLTANDEVQNRIFGPAGLDIGATQPEEIAISIVAEIISVMRNRPGSSLKDRQEPINDR